MIWLALFLILQIQVMQYFSGLENTNDYFDRGNFFNYLYNNALRCELVRLFSLYSLHSDKIRSTTSCGTNALWSMREHRIRHGDDFEFQPFQFQVSAMFCLVFEIYF